MGAPNNALSPIKSIQRSYSNPASGASNITISAVNMAKTVVFCEHGVAGQSALARITTATNVALECSSGALSLSVTVIEYN